MFFIYSLSLEDFVVKLYDFCRTKDGVDELLDTVARNFIRREEGERRAESPYQDDVPDDKITEDGYFLRHSAEKPHQIDVYLRKTQILPGRVWNSYDITCKKVLHFSVTEAALGLPIECTGKGVTTKTFDTAKEAYQQSEHMEKLKARIAEQRKKVDEQIAKEQPHAEYKIPEAQESDDEAGEIHEGPLSILKKRIDCEDWNNKIEDAKNLLDNLSGLKIIEPIRKEIPYIPPPPPPPVSMMRIPTPPPMPPSKIPVPPPMPPIKCPPLPVVLPEDEWSDFQGAYPAMPPSTPENWNRTVDYDTDSDSDMDTDYE